LQLIQNYKFYFGIAKWDKKNANDACGVA